jgi:hypothetical protein
MAGMGLAEVVALVMALVMMTTCMNSMPMMLSSHNQH